LADQNLVCSEVELDCEAVAGGVDRVETAVQHSKPDQARIRDGLTKVVVEEWQTRAEPGLSMTIYAAEPDSPAAQPLALLASWAATQQPTQIPARSQGRARALLLRLRRSWRLRRRRPSCQRERRAFALAVSEAGGATVRTVALLTPEEVDAAAKHSVEYRPPMEWEALHFHPSRHFASLRVVRSEGNRREVEQTLRCADVSGAEQE
jgi:hypothetical protein